MSYYIINNQTVALQATLEGTKIIEINKTLFLPNSINQIINYNCYLNGSTLLGRLNASSYILGSKYKLPIVINEQNNLILVPTHSLRCKECLWLVLNKLIKYSSEESNTILEFQNQIKLVINLAYTKMDRQILKATRLESVLRGYQQQFI